jgi:hypothetical protein
MEPNYNSSVRKRQKYCSVIICEKSLNYVVSGVCRDEGKRKVRGILTKCIYFGTSAYHNYIHRTPFFIITETIIWMNILTLFLTMRQFYGGWPIMFGPHRVEGSDTEPTSPGPASSS